jgi:hypothetical protein
MAIRGDVAPRLVGDKNLGPRPKRRGRRRSAGEQVPGGRRRRAGHNGPPPVFGREECLEQLLEAFADIADRDDIHQAAERLVRVQDWIKREAEQAAADPIFAASRLAS